MPSAGNGSHLLTYNVFADWDKPKHAPGGPGLPDTEPSALVPPPSKGARGVPSPLIASWAFIKELRWAAQIAATLGYADDAQAYAERARVSGEAFVGAYFRRLKQSSAFSFADDSLTAQAANALGLDLFGTNNSGSEATLSPAQQQQAVTSMVSALDAAANHSIAGIIGQAALYPVLSDFGHVGRALAANVVCTYPSFCDEIENHNATTLWETFDGSISHNHIMFGTQSAWYFRSLAGIRMNDNDVGAGVRGRVERLSPGFDGVGSGWRDLLLQPRVACAFLGEQLGELQAVAATLVLPLGVVKSAWRLNSCPDVPTVPTGR